MRRLVEEVELFSLQYCVSLQSEETALDAVSYCRSAEIEGRLTIQVGFTNLGGQHPVLALTLEQIAQS